MRQFHATVHGRGEPVLFLPGGGFTGSQGQLFAEALHNDFEVHLLDLPGFGESEGLHTYATSKILADWIEAYRTSRQLESIRLIGHSMGGAIALAYAVHYPDQVRRLILLDQGHKPNAMIPFREYGIFGFALPLLRLLYHNVPLSFLNWIETQASQRVSIFSEEQFQLFCQRIGVEPTASIRSAVEQSARLSTGGLHLLFGYDGLDFKDLLRRVQVPTHLYYADFTGIDLKEAKRTLHHVKRAERHLHPSVQLIAVPGGHFVQWSRHFSMENVLRFLHT
ncbi:alpha/beta hydrolase [Exiguobacterium profundum]|uniref:Alpha/beta hydrolase n=1 Tax=Exiguobacterium profundum TaxID=307643 RepID=A0ABY8B6Z9_9BACL|nr:alpha/beta hydrolase [Exiguobacterium profundum]WED56702.1 alpha/beta hydrolase [Exiguobacterium profundum]